MISLYIILALIAASLIYMRFETGFLKVDRVNLSKGTKGLKAVQLSDIHINRLNVSPSKIREVFETEKPDVVLMTGDYIEKQKYVKPFLEYLDSIRHGQKIILCLGNHDYETFEDDEGALEDFIKVLESKGCTVLTNETVQIQKDGKKYNITGIGDLRSNRHDIEKALSSCDKDAFATIAISHNPDVILDIPKNSIDYLLGGHFHGGQIWMPFNLEFRVLREDKLCRMGIRKGLHKINGTNVYLNRGLGNVCLTLRFFSRPEITVIQFP